MGGGGQVCVVHEWVREREAQGEGVDTCVMCEWVREWPRGGGKGVEDKCVMCEWVRESPRGRVKGRTSIQIDVPEEAIGRGGVEEGVRPRAHHVCLNGRPHHDLDTNMGEGEAHKEEKG